MLNKDSEGYENKLRRCSAYCTAERYQMQAMRTWLKKASPSSTYFRSSDVIHRNFGNDHGDVFYFDYGAVVLWGLSSDEEQKILKELKRFEEKPISSAAFEESRFSVGTSPKIAKDDITLPSNDIVTKLAFSHGLAQSVKLDVFEHLILKRIENTRYVPDSLALKGRIPLSRRQLLCTMGTLLQERNSINLHTDILDTPDFFWERSDLEPLYRLIKQDLELTARVNVLNKRLNILKELFEVLGTELAHRHSSRLEWIIIILIAIEIGLVLTKELLQGIW